MERSVVLLVAGGLAVVAGLWLSTLATAGSALTIEGWALAAAGAVAQGVGIREEIEW